MKTITNVYNVYDITELPQEAQEKAHSDFIKDNDYWGLEDYITEYCQELLNENKDITGTLGTVYYSLSYCQGDGAMFEGDFYYKGYSISISQSGHYYHYNSKEITFNDFVGEDKETEEDKIAEEFNDLYVEICKKMAKAGYEYIEDSNSFESFKDSCKANQYTFTINGKMDNQ